MARGDLFVVPSWQPLSLRSEAGPSDSDSGALDLFRFSDTPIFEALHLDRADAFRDLFDVAQPRARLEDLVRDIGTRRGIVCVASRGSSATSRIRRAGMDVAVNGSSSSLQLLREVDAQIEALPG